MSWFNVLMRWQRRTFAVDASARAIFYRILEAQHRGGVRLLTICQNLANRTTLAPGLRKLAAAGADAASSGRLASDGFADSGFLPPSDIGVLRVAERNGLLTEALAQLNRDERTKLNIPRGVLQPIAFQFVPFALALTMMIGSPVLIVRIVQDPALLENIQLYTIAISFRETAWVSIPGIFGTIGCIAMTRSRWTGTRRRWLLLFDRDWREQVAIQYCHIGAALTRHGATHLETLDAFEDVNDSGAVRTWLPLVRADIRAGRAYAASLSERLLPADAAGLLEDLVPGEERVRYANAFETVAATIEATLAHRYANWARMLKLFLMTTTVAMILLMVQGLFDAARQLTSGTGYF